MEVTTRFTATVGKQTGFKSTMKMTGLMKTGGLMNTIKSSMHSNPQQKTVQDQAPSKTQGPFRAKTEHKSSEKTKIEDETDELVQAQLESSGKQMDKETEIQEVDQPCTQKIDTTNPLIPYHKHLKEGVKSKELPQKYENKEEFNELNLEDTFKERDYAEFRKSRLGTAERARRNIEVKPMGLGGKLGPQINQGSPFDTAAALQKQFLQMREGASN